MPKQKGNAHSLQIALIINEPPDDLAGEFGIQDRNQSLHTGELVGVKRKLYCTIEALIGQEVIDFRGRFVHGPIGDRFVYLALRRPDGTWVRRMKVALGGITSELIEAAQGKMLVATINRLDSSRAKLQTADWFVE